MQGIAHSRRVQVRPFASACTLLWWGLGFCFFVLARSKAKALFSARGLKQSYPDRTRRRWRENSVICVLLQLQLTYRTSCQRPRRLAIVPGAAGMSPYRTADTVDRRGRATLLRQKIDENPGTESGCSPVRLNEKKPHAHPLRSLFMRRSLIKVSRQLSFRLIAPVSLRYEVRLTLSHVAVVVVLLASGSSFLRLGRGSDAGLAGWW